MTSAEPGHGRRPSLLSLLRADYAVLDELGGRGPGFLAPVRFVVNPSFRAALLFRLAARAHLMKSFWRSLLMWLHGCEVMAGAEIGPGVRLPHPIGITLAHRVVVGTHVTISQNVTIGADRDFEAQPVIGDRVTILPNAVVAGAIKVGDGALIGANTVVREDVEAGGLAVATGTEIRSSGPGQGADAWAPPGG